MRASGAGRPRKSIEQHRFDGTFQESRHGKLRDSRIELPAVQAETFAPPWLDAIGAEHWRYYAGLLSEARILTDADVTLLAAASEQWSLYRRASKALQGELVIGRQSRPEVGIASRALSTYTALMREFGVGPISRSRMQIKPPEKKDTGVEGMFT